jgi:molybdate transport system ATP-binding protein
VAEPLAPRAAPRLAADFTMRRAGFHLHARLELGAEILVLFGPSGSGKTTTLNAIAGLITPERGYILLDGRPLFRRDAAAGPVTHRVPARQRNIGYVFQNYALFPHLTALENVGFGVRGAAGRATAAAWLARMNLAHLADRYPHELSGGQQQRVAIARALAPAPRVLLLDEPFSALDAAARQRVQRELAALQREMQLVVIYVTHRLEDAFAVGDRLAVMRDGQLEQTGAIEDVFRYPATQQVAEIMGVPNLFRARVVEVGPEGTVLDWHGLQLSAPPHAFAVGRTVTAYIQPEDIKILYPDRPVMDAVQHNVVAGRIVESSPRPGMRQLRVCLANGHEIEVRHPAYTYRPLSLQPGEEVRLSLRKEALVVISHGGEG